MDRAGARARGVHGAHTSTQGHDTLSCRARLVRARRLSISTHRPREGAPLPPRVCPSANRRPAPVPTAHMRPDAMEPVMGPHLGLAAASARVSRTTRGATAAVSAADTQLPCSRPSAASSDTHASLPLLNAKRERGFSRPHGVARSRPRDRISRPTSRLRPKAPPPSVSVRHVRGTPMPPRPQPRPAMHARRPMALPTGAVPSARPRPHPCYARCPPRCDPCRPSVLS